MSPATPAIRIFLGRSERTPSRLSKQSIISLRSMAKKQYDSSRKTIKHHNPNLPIISKPAKRNGLFNEYLQTELLYFLFIGGSYELF